MPIGLLKCSHARRERHAGVNDEATSTVRSWGDGSARDALFQFSDYLEVDVPLKTQITIVFHSVVSDNTTSMLLPSLRIGLHPCCCLWVCSHITVAGLHQSIAVHVPTLDWDDLRYHLQHHLVAVAASDILMTVGDQNVRAGKAAIFIRHVTESSLSSIGMRIEITFHPTHFTFGTLKIPLTYYRQRLLHNQSD